MNSNTKFAVLFSFILVVIISCSPALYLPTLADSQKTGIAVDTLSMGRKLYVNNCGSCHNLYKAESYRKSEWYKILPEMQKKTDCNNQQKKLIFNYLMARSKDSQSPVY